MQAETSKSKDGKDKSRHITIIENNSQDSPISKTEGNNSNNNSRRSSINEKEDYIPEAGDVETEIAAQVVYPPDGGWGWVVLFSAFFALFIIDGFVYSFGPILPNVCDDLKVSPSMGVLINSIQISVYLLLSPVVSALINRFGFRLISMTGSIICSSSTFAAQYRKSYISLLVLYGVINGLGCSMVSLAANVIVGFYFEKKRSVVMPLVSSGTSIGIMVLYPLNVQSIAKVGWQTTLLLQSGLFGVIYFLSLAYRPLVTLTLVATEENGDPTRTVTYLPSKSTGRLGVRTSSIGHLVSRTLSNTNFPTAAQFVEDAMNAMSLAEKQDTSTTEARLISGITFKTQSFVSPKQIKEIQSIVSSKDLKADNKHISFAIEIKEKPTKKSYFGDFCEWVTDPPEFRPLYRDDAFYDAQIKKLPAYSKSVMEFDDRKASLAYLLQVSRTMTVEDLKERKTLCSTAVLRILATMLDLKLLKRPSFVIFCLSSFLLGTGVNVPYVFMQSRGDANGLHPTHSAFFVSVISLSNLIGRVVATLISLKIEAVYVFGLFTLLTGVATVFSGMSYTLVYQYGYCVVFGVCIAASACLRAVIIVDNFGLESLTNGFGLILTFNGAASVIGTPLAAYMIENVSYDSAFHFSGGVLILSAIVVFLVKPLRMIEDKRKENEQARTFLSLNSLM